MNEKLSPERLAEIRTRRDEGLECHDGYHVCETWVPEARQLLWSWSSIRGVGTCVENDIPALLAHIAAVEAERDALAAKIARVEALPKHWRDWMRGRGQSPYYDAMNVCADELDAALRDEEAPK
jgi:hypothetical protein